MAIQPASRLAPVAPSSPEIVLSHGTSAPSGNVKETGSSAAPA